MDLVVIAVTTAMSLTSLPVAFFLNKLDLMRDQRAVLAVGIPCLFLSALVPILVIRRRYRNVDFIIYSELCLLLYFLRECYVFLQNLSFLFIFRT